MTCEHTTCRLFQSSLQFLFQSPCLSFQAPGWPLATPALQEASPYDLKVQAGSHNIQDLVGLPYTSWVGVVIQKLKAEASRTPYSIRSTPCAHASPPDSSSSSGSSRPRASSTVWPAGRPSPAGEAAALTGL